jgi:hypothetical protein
LPTKFIFQNFLPIRSSDTHYNAHTIPQNCGNKKASGYVCRRH